MLQSASSSPLRPGFLFEPLGWFNAYVSDCMRSDPSFCQLVYGLTPYRMHFAALGIAHHREGQPSRWLIRALLEEKQQPVPDWPQGLARALSILPNAIMKPRQYRQLISLLHDRSTAKFLHHRRAIDGRLIGALARLPAELRRPAIFGLFDEIEGMEHFAAGLRLLGQKTGLCERVLRAELGALHQTGQVVARVVSLVDSLALPETIPPMQIGRFRRVDAVSEIQTLAKEWTNCLGDCLHAIGEGASLIYLSNVSGPPIIALLQRADRLGWYVSQMRGPSNLEYGPEITRACYREFKHYGIARLETVAAVRDLMLRRRWWSGD